MKVGGGLQVQGEGTAAVAPLAAQHRFSSTSEAPLLWPRRNRCGGLRIEQQSPSGAGAVSLTQWVCLNTATTVSCILAAAPWDTQVTKFSVTCEICYA